MFQIVTRLLRSLLDPYGWLPILVPDVSPTPDEQIAFAAHLKDHQRAAGVSSCLSFVLGALLFWPTDQFVFAGRPRELAAFSQLRIMVTLLGVFWVAFVRLFPKSGEHPTAICVAGGSSMILACGYSLSELGGVDSVWFYCVFLIPMVTKVFVLTATESLLMNGSFTLSYLLGYFLPHPEYASHPMTASILVFEVFLVGFINLGISELHLRLSRSNFVRTLRHKHALLEREHLVQQLDEHRAALERRVQERTQDLNTTNLELRSENAARIAAETKVMNLARNLQTVQEQERRTLAREVHDQLGQWLTGLELELRTLQYGLPDVNFQRPLSMVAQLKRSAREVINLLRPEVLDRHGLQAALESLMDSIRSTSKLHVELEIGLVDEGLERETQTALYRITQEAATNVLRHADAKRLHVSLSQDGDLGLLRITDDGVGFDPERIATSTAGGMGLLGIDERVNLLYGSYAWSRLAAGGSQLEVTFPLPSSDKGHR